MFEIFYKDILVFKIDIYKSKGSILIVNEKYLPFDIYLEESEDIDDRINNMVNFNAWSASRVLPLDREYAKEILNYYGLTQGFTDADRAKIAISTRCLSLNDCFWLRDEKESLTWKEVNLFDNSIENAIFEVALFGKTSAITNTELINPDLTTDGKAPKAWLRENSSFYLLKGNKDDSVRKEIEASHILNTLGIQNVGYNLYYFNNEPVSRCKCFTNEFVNFVRADWYHIWCLNHDQDITDYIFKHKEAFDRMNLADYLIGNNDEHALNWGFLYDNNMSIISMNPLMDYDHAFESGLDSMCLPARFLGINITQKEMALSIIKAHPDWILQDVDLSIYKYGSFVQERIDLLYKELKSY